MTNSTRHNETDTMPREDEALITVQMHPPKRRWYEFWKTRRVKEKRMTRAEFEAWSKANPDIKVTCLSFDTKRPNDYLLHLIETYNQHVQEGKSLAGGRVEAKDVQSSLTPIDKGWLFDLKATFVYAKDGVLFRDMRFELVIGVPNPQTKEELTPLVTQLFQLYFSGAFATDDDSAAFHSYLQASSQGGSPL